VNDDAATNSTVGTGGAGLGGARNLQAPRLRQQRLRIEAENCNPDGAHYASLEECSSRYIHYAALHDERLGTVNWYRDGTEALEKRKCEAAIKVCAVRSTSLPGRSPYDEEPTTGARQRERAYTGKPVLVKWISGALKKMLRN